MENTAEICNNYPGPEAAIASALCAVAYALLPSEETKAVDMDILSASEEHDKIEALLDGDPGDGLAPENHTASYRVARLLRQNDRNRTRLNAIRQAMHDEHGRPLPIERLPQDLFYALRELGDVE